MGTLYRVTGNSIARNSLDNLQTSLNKLQDLTDQQSSGKRIRKPSDDPTGAVQAMAYRADETRNKQYSRNAEDGIGWLSTADRTMTSSLNDIARVRGLILAGANGTADKESRSAMAAEVASNKQTLIGLANTAYNNRPIFAGTANPTGLVPPLETYDVAGNYNGNTGAVYRTVGPNASVQVNVDGPSVWGPPGSSDLWSILDDIQKHMNSTDPVELNKLNNSWVDGTGTTIKSDLDRLDDIRVNIQNRLSEVGARYHRVETMNDRAKDNQVTIQGNLSAVENIDLTKTIIDLQLQQTAYQAALSATAKVIQPSLVDFLK